MADHAARFALLKSQQADVVYYVTWPLAKDLAKSEETHTRGSEPWKRRDLWTQQYRANGMLVLDFYLPIILRESQKPDQAGSIPFGTVVKTFEYPEEYIDHPTLDMQG